MEKIIVDLIINKNELHIFRDACRLMGAVYIKHTQLKCIEGTPHGDIEVQIRTNQQNLFYIGQVFEQSKQLITD